MQSGDPNGNGHSNGHYPPRNPPPGPGDPPDDGDTIEICGVQRHDESHPCENVEPCDKHCGAKLRGV